MEDNTFKIFDGKVIIRSRDRICDTPEEMLSSSLFRVFLKRSLADLSRKNSKLVNIFDHKEITDQDIQTLIDTLMYLVKLPAELVPRIVDHSDQFFRDTWLFNDFIEYLYNAWRSLQRLIICDSEGDRLDKRPYRTFNRTVEALTQIIRSTYRDIQENITGVHPKIYRQVRAGAEIAAIALPKDVHYPGGVYDKLSRVSVIRQVLIYPPLIFTPPMNKRTGEFERVYQNPLDAVEIEKENYLCYPARVGPLIIMIYFSIRFFELGFALCNLFELADDEDLKHKPDAVFVYGAPDGARKADEDGKSETIFFEDEANDILVATIPDRNEFGYFGYLKKMVLTLHNIKMMKLGRLPFHGALVNLSIRNKGSFTILTMGDTGAGKSETLEAFRSIGGDDIEDITIIADDMGSLDLDESGRVIGYGTETGAFVRLDDLQPGYAFGQIDRTIIMSPNQTNARVVLPVTTYANVIKGFPVDFVFYANNYEAVDEEHPIIEQLGSPRLALDVFRAGKVMSKGTTTTTGLVGTYFANIFGPVQYQSVHEELASRYFNAFYDQNLFVGQMRTQLGLPGKERQGPQEAAKALLSTLRIFNRKGPNGAGSAASPASFESPRD